MATDPIREPEMVKRELLRPPVKGGTGHIESLGALVDNLMGHSKIEGQVRDEMETFMSKLNSSSGADEDSPAPLPDPEPTQAPPPVPDGTGVDERGAAPSDDKGPATR